MPLIKRYEIFIKGDKDSFMTVDQLEGQKLIMLLCKPNRPEFVVINGNCLSLNMVAAIKRLRNSLYQDGILIELGDKRELTEEEAEVERMFDEIQNKKLLLK